jgi:mannose-6-phosphate isomerase
MERVRLLRNPIRAYAWGSTTALAELTGRPFPASGPEAELWMGAHPAAPSLVCDDAGRVSLLEWIRRAPVAMLGAEAAARFGAQLPFLFKVLAPECALSIQAHPDAARAREGFERENAAGLAGDDPRRNYRDPNPKSELICALTRFEALCGFRAAEEIVEGLGALGAASLDQALAELRASPGRDGIARFFADVMRRPPEGQARIAREVAEAAGRGAGDAQTREWIVELAREHPRDVGVLAPVLLNLVSLGPGEALFLPPGEIHAYLRGLGVEIMGNSDNVLRGGLTRKHVDVPELLATLTFRQGPAPVLRPRPVAPGEAVYDTPAREFVLSVLRPSSSSSVGSAGPHSAEILFCAEGEAAVRDLARDEVLPLPRGAAAFVPAAVERYRVEGQAAVFRAGVPR